MPRPSAVGTPSASEPSPAPATTAPVAPTLDPAVANGDDEAAALGFVKHYYDMVNYALASGDVKGLRALGVRSCASCRGGLKAITGIYHEGGSISGGQYTVDSGRLSRAPRRVGASWLFDVEIEASHTAQTVRRTSTSEPQVNDAGTVRQRFSLTRSAQGWSVLEWESLQ